MTEEQKEVNLNDTEDAFPAMGGFENSKKLVARMPTERHASEYNMKHKNRGQAIIFNHKDFDNPDLDSRSGTDKDCKSLYASLENLNFNVKDYHDRTVKQIQNIIEQAARADHTNSDCIVIAILSHGEMGYIHAKDCQYKLDTIAQYFTADNCKTLAGKPKLFFIQACQGDRLDSGIMLTKTETDGDPSTSYRIPIHADFLFAYSTIPGFYSWRNSTKGSWFIESLCKELDDNGKHYDILTLLTFVSQRVAFDFESHNNEKRLQFKKQIPCTTTMLTRILKFPDKK